jgi:hypothetical protein
VVGACVGQGLDGGHLAGQPPAAHQGDDEVAVAGPGSDRAAADHLGDRGGVLVPADGVLAAPHRVLALGLLRHRHAVALDQLVDHAGGRRARSGDQRGADAVAVDRGGHETGDRVLVQVAGDDDAGASRPEGVQQLPGVRGERRQVTGVQPDGAQLRTGDLDRRPNAPVDVEGVHEQRRPGAEGVDLGLEGRALVVVQQREGVRARAGGRNAVAPSGLEVGGGREADQVGGAGGGHRGLLVGAPRAHLDARPLAGGRHHARRGRGDGAVVVEDRQREGLEQHALGEGGTNGQHRRAGEEQLPLGVAVDVAAEAEVGQPVQQRPVGDALGAQRGQLVVAEAEVRERGQQAGGACDHAEPPAVGESPREDLEHAVAVGGAVGQGGGHHRQLVAVGEQRGSRREQHGGRHGGGA